MLSVILIALYVEIMMSKYSHIFQINEIPDVEYLEYQVSCQNGVQETISNHFRYLLKKISTLKTGEVEVTLRIAYKPASKHKSLQSRMSIFLILNACDRALLDDLKTSVEKGGLSKFYNFISVDTMELSWDNINEISVITREENLIKPSIPCDYNYKIPSYYYSIQPFEANEQNDFMDLDKILDKVHEIVIIDVAVKPMEIKPLCLLHANYLSNLKDINNSWSINNDELSQVDYYDNTQSLYSQNNDTLLAPLKIKDPVADEIFSKQRRFNETLYDDHLIFNIRVLSETARTNSLVTSCVADSGFKNGHYQIFSSSNNTKEFESVLSSAKHLCSQNVFFSKTKTQNIDQSIYTNIVQLNQYGTIEELSGIFRLPMANLRSPFCIRKNTDPLMVSCDAKSISIGTDEEIKDFSIEIPLNFFCKHFSIFGMSGSGKTTAIQNFMFNLWEHRAPFLVIETAKAEYRNLKFFKELPEKKANDLAKHLQIYTLGNEEISPFRMNPLIIPKNTSLDNHIATLLTFFQSAIPMSGPLPSLITEGLGRLYEEYPDNQHPPILQDLLKAIQKVFREKAYSLETQQDISTAIEVRLNSLISGSTGKIFQCPQNIPGIPELTDSLTILEFEGLSNEQKCFLTLIILTQIKEYIKASYRPGNRPRFVVFIEEAHNIIGRSFNASPSPDNADPKAFVTDLICNMLAELRSLGIGIVIIDQLPSAIAPQVIKNTATKLAFRQVDREDRETLGSAMLFRDYEFEDIARLKTWGGVLSYGGTI